ncbi:hypothetical protein MNV_610006 [Candidatus Methanoperedens nitroreducens]|uniref:DJ-1/PfpI domain-containing protein n=1 Tax=Candidatus Methanoperedens nitratireducens TaxID=1392998 RepID=A0A284VSP8_9EURY|nr:DJ-1/PfpI family protein [Candidatus Methanoperedens nitroreducens]SNQ62213.1 hypothetical protein MNV_610006 [Candidatus Methanoperedens nitroreducens]
MKALIISADNFEDTELFYPLHRLKEEDIAAEVASMKEGQITGKHGYSIHVDLTLAEVKPEEFDMLVLPGEERLREYGLMRKRLRSQDIFSMRTSLWGLYATEFRY